MGIDYAFFPVVGFVVTEATLIPLTKILPEVSHTEQRFDPKTGNEIESVKVVDRAVSSVYVLDGKELIDREDEPFDFAQMCREIGRRIDCAAEICGSALNDDLFCVFGPRFHLLRDSISLSDGNIEASHPMLLSDVFSAKAQIDVIRIEGQLRSLGLDLKQPIVGVGWYIS